MRLQTRDSLIITRESFTMQMLVLVCFVTNLSQMTTFIDAGLSTVIGGIAWLICGSCLLINGYFNLRKRSLTIIIVSCIFCFLVLLNFIITREDYWASAHIKSLVIALYVYFIGCGLSSNISFKTFDRVIWAYVISACIVAIDVYIRFFASGFDIASRIYVYDSKNSLSQILLTAIVLLVFGLNKKEKGLAIKWGIIIGLFLLLCAMKSRATLLGFFAIYFFFLANRNIRKSIKICSIILVIGALVFIMTNASAYKLIINDIIFAGRNATNINDITSGRVYLINEALRLINDYLFFGVGSYYLDCYPIAVILQFGLLPGIVLCIVAVLPLFFIIREIRYSENSYNIYISFFIIVVTYLINGIFEALTPLGPGVKCYFLWLLYGILINRPTAYVENKE